MSPSADAIEGPASGEGLGWRFVAMAEFELAPIAAWARLIRPALGVLGGDPSHHVGRRPAVA